MKRSRFVLPAAMVIIAAALLLGQRSAPPASAGGWEYASYLHMPEMKVWQESGRSFEEFGSRSSYKVYLQLGGPPGVGSDEYALVHLFNTVGAQGWELTEIVHIGDSLMYYFKRPRK